MRPDPLRAALFVTAVLAGCDKLDYRLRAAILHRVPSFDVDRDGEISEALAESARGCGLVPSAVPRPSAALLHQARSLAGEWQAQGIRIIASEGLCAGGDVTDNIPAVFFAVGNLNLLGGRTAAVLNSRHGRKIRPDDRWVITTKHLLDYAVSQELAVVSSTGTLPYSVACRAARGSPLVVVCDHVLPFMLPITRRKEFFERHADLFDVACTLFLSPFSPGKLPSRPARMALRDQVVSATASVILVADVRPDGSMRAILENAAKRDLSILGLINDDAGNPKVGPITQPGATRRRQRTQSRVRARHLAKPPATEAASSGPYMLNPLKGSKSPQSPPPARFQSGSAKGRLQLTSLGRSFLIHYTRGCPGPWPGQTMGEYCQTLIDGCPSSAHTAFDTLNRILAEGVIRAGSRLIRGQRPVVSFTECLPEEIEPLVAWRNGLLRWSFERYGIAIRKGILVARGARRVIYGDESVFHGLPDNDRHFFQRTKTGKHDWTAEREWRLPGDLALAEVPRSHIAAIVPTLEEAARISSQHDVPVARPRQRW